MACSHYNQETKKCLNGFPVSTGCWATEELEKNTIRGVRCNAEEWCGWAYWQDGGKPLTEKEMNEKLNTIREI